MEKLEYFEILNTNVNVTTMDKTVKYISENLEKIKGGYICVANVHTTVMSYENDEYRAVQNNSVMTLPDGAPLSKYCRMKGVKHAQRVTGPDLMLEIFKISAKNGYRHYFYGSKDETLEIMKKNLERQYPGIQIVGMYSPPFRELTKKEDELAVKRINEANPDFVWVGLGAPKQELWMGAHNGCVNGLMIGVGAGFDYVAGNIKRAPKIMQKLCLEWLYRLLQDSRRLWKRYLVYNFKFFILILTAQRKKHG